MADVTSQYVIKELKASELQKGDLCANRTRGYKQEIALILSRGLIVGFSLMGSLSLGQQSKDIYDEPKQFFYSLSMGEITIDGVPLSVSHDQFCEFIMNIDLEITSDIGKNGCLTLNYVLPKERTFDESVISDLISMQ